MSIAIYAQKSSIFDYNFPGNNGDPPDSNVWVPGYWGDDNGRGTLYNNSLRFESPSGLEDKEIAEYRSVFYLYGEFDIQISFYIDTLTVSGANNISTVSFGFGHPDSYDMINYIERINSIFGGLGHCYFAKTQYTSGNYDTTNNDWVGQFRIKREIYDESLYWVTFWYYDHDTGYWVFEGNNDGWGYRSARGGDADAAHVVLSITNDFGEVDARFTSFHVTSGTVVWP